LRKQESREILSWLTAAECEVELNSGGSMIKRYYPWIVMIALLTGSLSGIALIRPSEAKAPPQQYPIMDKVADKIILKYQQSSCEQLWMKKSEKAPPTVEEQKAVAFLKSDPQMRTAFINKVAPPIANKMFDCGMIP
jgi:hypothetical protein